VSKLGGITDKAERAGRDAHESDWFDHLIRIGLVAFGVVHLMLAWLALQLAFGDTSENASSQGAVRELASQPFGEVLVWLIAVGMFLLVAWRLLEAAMGHRDEDGAKRAGKRVVSLGKAIVYAAIGVSALQIAIGAGSGGGGGTDSMTSKLMDLPAGPWIVGLVGLVIVGIGLALVIRAWTEGFKEHLSAEGRSGETGTAYIWFGKIGYCAKGVAIGIVGVLFVYAGVTHDPDKSGGLDQALQQVLEQPFGPFLLGVIAIGIGCYGLFCFAEARHLSR
jgi:hypothetical protein